MLNNLKKDIFALGALTILVLGLFFLTNKSFLTFSDAAKMADIAKNILQKGTYGSDFNFFGSNIFDHTKGMLFSASEIPPVTPYLIAVFFKIFGISDFAVTMCSYLFYVLSVFIGYFLAREIFGRLVGLTFGLTLSLSPFMLDYATTGASESVFIFEVLLCFYLVLRKSVYSDLLAGVFAFLMYFTRPQAFIYISGLMLLWLLLRYSLKKSIVVLGVALFLGFLFDNFLLSRLYGKYFLYSVTKRGLDATTIQISGEPSSDSLRGAVAVVKDNLAIPKKIFYNLYNFYKLTPQIFNPFLFAFFVVSFLGGKRGVKDRVFLYSTLFVFLLTLISAAVSIPLFRYINPVAPLVYLLAISYIVADIRIRFRERSKLTYKKVSLLLSVVLVLIFVGGNTLGKYLLDARYESKRTNKGKDPVYVLMARSLMDFTSEDDLVLTNLDTWGSWYGNRMTVWFPLSPELLVPPKGKTNPFRVIYLTNYKIDDQNSYMGEEWRQLLITHKTTPNSYVDKNYVFIKEIIIPKEDTYENIEGKISVFYLKNESI